MSRPDEYAVQAPGRTTTLLVACDPSPDEAPRPGSTGPMSRVQRRQHAGRPGDPSTDARWRLERLVAAGSTDVRVHLARVNQHIEGADGAATYGALVDLFIAVGPGASEVRNRALFWARDVLAADHYGALAAHVDGGLPARAPMPAAVCSVRSLGVTGSTLLVVEGRADDVRRAGLDADGVGQAGGDAVDRDAVDRDAVDGDAVDGARSPGPEPPPVAGVASVAGSSGRPPMPLGSALPPIHDAPPPSHVADGWFDSERTVLGALRRHAGPDTAFTLAGPFGRIDVAAESVWVRLAPGGVSALASDFTERVAIRRVDPRRIDRTGARPLDAALWDLTALVSGGRLPLGLPTDVPLRLREAPELRSVVRIDRDVQLASSLLGRPARVSELRDDAATRTFLAAAWISGLLVPAPATSRDSPDDTQDDTPAGMVRPRLRVRAGRSKGRP